MGGRRRCCCKRGCDIVHDDFNRADSTTIGSSWVEESGEWEIDSNTLTETTGTGIIRTTKRHPANHPTGHYGVTFLNLQHGNKYRLLFNVLDDENYYYVEYYYWLSGQTNMSTLTIGQVEGIADTVVDSVTQQAPEPGRNEALIMCRLNSGVYTTSASTGQLAVCGLSDNGGRRAGLANASGSNALAFDDFTWDEHYNSNKDCEACFCNCGGYCIPSKLTMTIVADCDLDGLTTSGYGHPTSEGEWQFSFANWLYLYSGGGMVTDQMFRVYCPCFGHVPAEDFEGPECEAGENFFLCDVSYAQLPNMPGWTHSCYGGGLSGAYATDYTCNPLWWQFGPFEIREYNESPEGYEVLCTFMVHVTE